MVIDVTLHENILMFISLNSHVGIIYFLGVKAILDKMKDQDNRLARVKHGKEHLFVAVAK